MPRPVVTRPGTCVLAVRLSLRRTTLLRERPYQETVNTGREGGERKAGRGGVDGVGWVGGWVALHTHKLLLVGT